jgi:tetratricopeptide (TPR) repeat protein
LGVAARKSRWGRGSRRGKVGGGTMARMGRRAAFNLCVQAEVLLEVGRVAEAADVARQAAAADPTAVDAWRLLAHALVALDQPADALDAADHALALAPGEPAVLYTLGQCQLAAWRTTEARVTADRLAELAPDWAHTHELAGAAAYAAQRPTEAADHLERAAALDPSSDRIRRALDVAHRAARSKERRSIERRLVADDEAAERAARRQGLPGAPDS